MEKNNVAKIILVDRGPEQLSGDELAKYESEYLEYCKAVYDWVEKDSGIPDKDARNMVFERTLSPFQYFLEDKVRMKRFVQKTSGYPNMERR